MILRAGKNPVLSHLWLNYMLDLKNAKSNAAFTGYQTPHNGIDPNTMVSDGTIPSNLAGHPAMTVPFALSDEGLPIGVQLFAPALGESELFRAGAVLEAALPSTVRGPVAVNERSIA